jgi:hypothetical protein
VTEAEWLACPDPRLSLVFLEGKASERKARLFACGVGRSLWPYLGDHRSRRVVEVAEMNADNLATAAELARAEDAVLGAVRGTASRVAAWVGNHGPWQAARMVMVTLRQAQTEIDAKSWRERLAGRALRILRCVFANPFRPATVSSAWLTWQDGLLVSMARQIYETRNFADMPILADALEEAGCTDADILNHCRQPGEHVRGCWVVDLLLGKS